MKASSCDRHKSILLELFVVSNFAFLSLDIYLAHSVNRFRHQAEWIPFVFSLAAFLVLAAALACRHRRHGTAFFNQAGTLLGYGSILVGVSGLLFHLHSQFFQRWTLDSLVYTAPFAAPLAYCGLGFLLLLNRMVPAEDPTWGSWVIFFALGGFFGNFVLSLGDHAQNGFFYDSEWIPVAGSAIAVGFLTVALFERDRKFLRLCLAALAIQALIGVAGFAFHLAANVNGISSSAYENFIHGAPVLAPLLFVNLALLGALGLIDVRQADEIAGYRSLSE
ncbi:MAG: hypothetical protein ACE5HV_13305 [Acidobacteriota bacterium]